jgi:hypothetical protein
MIDQKIAIKALECKISGVMDQLIELIPSDISFGRREIPVEIPESGIKGFLYTFGISGKSYYGGVDRDLPEDVILEHWQFREDVPMVANYYIWADVTRKVRGTGMMEANGSVKEEDGDFSDFGYFLVTDWNVVVKLFGEPIGYAENQVPAPRRGFGYFLSSFTATKKSTVMVGWRDEKGNELWAEVPPEVHVP